MDAPTAAEAVAVASVLLLGGVRILLAIRLMWRRRDQLTDLQTSQGPAASAARAAGGPEPFQPQERPG